MTVLTLFLNGSWFFTGFEDSEGEKQGSHKLDYNVQDWLIGTVPGTVPGTVHTDLMANNIIIDPFVNLNEKKSSGFQRVNGGTVENLSYPLRLWRNRLLNWFLRGWILQVQFG